MNGLTTSAWLQVERVDETEYEQQQYGQTAGEALTDGVNGDNATVSGLRGRTTRVTVHNTAQSATIAIHEIVLTEAFYAIPWVDQAHCTHIQKQPSNQVIIKRDVPTRLQSHPSLVRSNLIQSLTANMGWTANQEIANWRTTLMVCG